MTMAPDVFTKKTFDNMVGILAGQAIKPQFIIICTPGHNADYIAAALGVELNLDKHGEQLIGHYLIMAR